MKTTRIVLFASVSVTAGWVAGTWNIRPSRGPEVITFHTGVTVEQVQALSSLMTAKIDVADIQETRLTGRTGGMKAALLIKGDCLLGTDLSRAKFESVNMTAHTAVLVLQQPQVTSPRLDFDRSRVFTITDSGLWQITPGGGEASAALLNHAYRDAQRFIADACNDPSLLSRARHQAETVLQTFYEATGWKVTVRWEE